MREKSKFGIYGLEKDANPKIKNLLSKKIPQKYNLKYPKIDYPSDEITLKELETLKSFIHTERVVHKDFIEMADKNLVDCFIILLEKLNIEYTNEIKENINEIVVDSSVLTIKIKYLYNRARPYQVANIEGVEFEALNSSSAKTPSYPSGHTIQSLLIADYLSNLYPQYMDEFYALAYKISYSRMWGGFHFYSDIEYGKKIFKVIKMNNDNNKELAEKSIRKVGDKEPTNFPKKGDNKKVSLRNSKYKLFPIEYAENLRENYPKIWAKGGNIKGNDQFEILTKIQKENNGVPETDSQEGAIRTREAWAARHLKDFRIAGTIAQVKWLVIGSKGLSYMKNLIKEEISKSKKSSFREENMLEDLKCLSTKTLENGNKEYILNGKARTWFALDKMQLDKKEYGEDNQKTYSIFGIASSTSVDSYGTEMSIEALRSMALQFNRGLPVLPRHSSILSSGIAEWDEVIGRTMEAEIKRTQVVNPKEDREVQYSLFIRSELYADDEKSKDLIKRINRGEPIGQSIGGWFENVRVIENEDGEIQRVLVDDVTLDHVAITRAPSNPDSVDLMMMSIRSSIDNFNKDNIECLSSKPNVKGVDMIVDAIEKREYGHLDSEEEKKHEEGAVADDQDHIEYLEIDEAEDEGDEGYRGGGSDEEDSAEELKRLREENERMKKELAKLKEKSEAEEDEADEADEEDLIPEEDKRSFGNVDAQRAAVPYQDLPKAPIDMKWSFSAEDGNEILGESEDWAKYKRAHLWFDKNDAENKSGYKLPIAKIHNGKLSVFFRAIVAAMAALNGARGGVEIEESDKKSIYNSIQKYYEKFGETAPALKVENSDMPNITQNMDEELDNSVQSLNYNDNANRDTISNSMENTMTENDLQKLAEIISQSVRSAISTSTSKQEAKEVRTENKTELTEFDKLKQRLERTESMLNQYLEQPVRSGVHLPQVRAGLGAENEFSKIITRARSNGVVALSGVIERSVTDLSEEEGPSKMNSTQVRDLLIKGLRAAHVDGLI